MTGPTFVAAGALDGVKERFQIILSKRKPIVEGLRPSGNIIRGEKSRFPPWKDLASGITAVVRAPKIGKLLKLHLWL